MLREAYQKGRSAASAQPTFIRHFPGVGAFPGAVFGTFGFAPGQVVVDFETPAGRGAPAPGTCCVGDNQRPHAVRGL